MERDKKERIYKQGQFSSIDGENKQCSDCLETKLLNQFYKHKRYKDGYRNQCIKCHSNRWKNYYKNGYNAVLKEKVTSDIIYKLKQCQKSYIHQQLKKSNLKKSDRVSKYIGCSINNLKTWLEYQFSKDMNWNNQSIYWQLDHIIPLSLFNLHDEHERKLAFNWTNIQPYKKQDNLQKYNKFRPVEYFNSIINVSRFINKQKLSPVEFVNIKDSLNWIKSKYTFATLSNCGEILRG
jgi:hypothetical protein